MNKIHSIQRTLLASYAYVQIWLAEMFIPHLVVVYCRGYCKYIWCMTWKITETILYSIQVFVNECLRRIRMLWRPNVITNEEPWKWSNAENGTGSAIHYANRRMILQKQLRTPSIMASEMLADRKLHGVEVSLPKLKRMVKDGTNWKSWHKTEWDREFLWSTYAPPRSNKSDDGDDDWW